MSRVANFNAGPAALPLPVLERAREDLPEFDGTGMSIMEHSHRGKAYEGVHDQAIGLLRELAGIPDSHHVLLMQGGASHQFAMAPMNFLHGRSADYVNTGHWSERAMDEAQHYGKVRVAASTAGNSTGAADRGPPRPAEPDRGPPQFTRVPRQEELDLDPGAAYLHLTSNNTIEGTQFHYDVHAQVPLVADMSSDFLWKKQDYARYALIYAGAQKNLGPSGVTVVIARKDLVEGGRKDLPKIFQYRTFAANNSLYNTPPTFAIYLMRNVLDWIKHSGGIAQIQVWNQAKAKRLYGVIDAHGDYYHCPVAADSRSTMNVVFRLPSEALEDKFVKESQKAGLVGLKGHRSVGGIRASIYNAVSVDDVEKLAEFMEHFAKSNRP